jgi:hypothetical protein
MSDKPRRALFRLHLSTALLCMFALGGVLWANLLVRSNLTSEFDDHHASYEKMGYLGWPWPAYSKSSGSGFSAVLGKSIESEKLERQRELKAKAAEPAPTLSAFLDNPFAATWSATGICLDALTALSIVAFVAVASEILIRRRVGRKL